MFRRKKSTRDEESNRSEEQDDEAWDEDDRKTPVDDETHRERDRDDDDDDDYGDDDYDDGRSPGRSRRRSGRNATRSTRTTVTTTTTSTRPPPADSFGPGDIITVTVGKSDPRQDPGLKVEVKPNGRYYVRKVPSGGLFARTPVRAGDRILELNEIDGRDFRNVNEMKRIIRDEPRITVKVLRRDPDASDSSASSFVEEEEQDDDDFDGVSELTPIPPPARSTGPVKKDSFSLRAKNGK